MKRRSVLRTAIVASAAATLPAIAAESASAGATKTEAPTTRDIIFRRWVTDADYASGTAAGVTVSGGIVSFASTAGQTSYTDPHNGYTATYDYATWTSGQIAPGFAAQEIIASWTATTPGGSWVQIELRGQTALGNTTTWYVMGRWAAEDSPLLRTSLSGQNDTDGYVAIDTFVAAAGHELTSWQLRVTLLRPAGSADVPVLRSFGAMASRLPAPEKKFVGSTPQTAQGIVLNVPQYSQEIHLGQYPQYDNGGEAWCSPTSTSMVMGFWNSLPPAADYAWVDPSYQDPWVDHAARGTYDYNYTGCGNWPFNTAYAGRYGLSGFVTRLRSLNEAEEFIAAGIPLVVSASFKKGEIPGLNYGTGGHLMVIVGFTVDGQPVLNDPNSATDADVRKPVGRTEFENAWLSSSRGIVYVITPPGRALPVAPAQANW
jgi:hypothetical protein